MHFLIDSGYAPSVDYLYFMRNVLWMLLYLFMLIMVGITVALFQTIIITADTVLCLPFLMH